MSIKQYQHGITERIKGLIDRAGGATPFVRQVWPGENVAGHLGKVGKWYHGESGIRQDMGVTIAKAFTVRAAWLLYGELPEKADAESPPSQADDVHSLYRRQAPEFVPDWLRERIGALMGTVAQDLRLTDRPAAIRATMRLLTAMLSELRRARGEGAAKPEQMLRELHEWRGSQRLEDFLLASLTAARIIVNPARVAKPKPTNTKRRK